MNTTAHLFISGRVQGVFFRANTKKRARELGIKGWVKNLPDGRVEVMAEGEEEEVKELVEWCKSGSRHAEVTNVEVEYGEYQGELGDFEIRYEY